MVEHRDKPYRAVRSFSQEDINQGRIQYRPPPAPAHLQELYQYSFIGEDTYKHTPAGFRLTHSYLSKQNITCYNVLFPKHRSPRVPECLFHR